MRVLIAPDKFKDSLSAEEVCSAINIGIKKFDSSVVIGLNPLADGGEGSLDVIENHLVCKRISSIAQDSIGRVITADYLLSGDKAYLELAQANGLQSLKKSERNPLFTSSFGTGKLILDAINKGAKEINLFLGGSSTNDAAIGLMSALGVKFISADGELLKPIGDNLALISSLDMSNLRFNTDTISFYVFSDVDNLLYGKNGAAFTFAGQKGASREEIIRLNSGLINFSNVVKDCCGIDISKIKGGGAAGGIAAGMYGLLNATIRSGINEIIRITGLDQKMKNFDLIITGEGRLDISSFSGKVVGKVIELAKVYNKKVLVFVGENALNNSFALSGNIINVDSILQHSNTKEDAISNASDYLKEMVVQNISKIKIN